MASNNDTQQPAASGGFVPATAQSSKKAAPPFATGDSVSGVPGQYSRNNPNYHNRTSGPSRSKVAAIAVAIVVLVGAVAGGGLYAYKEFQKGIINENLHSMTEEETLKVAEELDAPVATFDEPFNVLLLGSDARADDPDMGARTDTIIVVRVDPVENIVDMVSIPRDTMIEIDGQGVQKFNAAYTFGGESGTIAAVKKLTGVEINHFAEVNFESLVGLIDAIGGIDVEVEEEIDDEDAGGHIDAGLQHLDGEHALIFSRSRQYVDGDFTRQVNQRKVILAIINRALTAPATELTGLIQASTEFVTTDSGIDFDFIYSLADQMRHNDKDITIYSATIPSSTANINEISYVVADTAGVAEMMKTFMKGGDVSKGVSASSISEDIEGWRTLLGASSGNDAGLAEEEVYNGGDYYYDPNLYEESYDEGPTISYVEDGAAQMGDATVIELPAEDEYTVEEDAADAAGVEEAEIPEDGYVAEI